MPEYAFRQMLRFHIGGLAWRRLRRLRDNASSGARPRNAERDNTAANNTRSTPPQTFIGTEGGILLGARPAFPKGGMPISGFSQAGLPSGVHPAQVISFR